MEQLIHRLESSTEAKRTQFRKDLADFAARHDLSDWEGWFSPCDHDTYAWVLGRIGNHDIVLDIGAGDLRLALQMAARARRVYAVEVNPLVLEVALREIGLDLPRNLQVICANALDVPIPSDVTVAVLLMRHCQHFAAYCERLQVAGCQRLITNARWKSNVEVIDLTRPPVPFAEVKEGWYACRCGEIGFIGGVERPDTPTAEVFDCPSCCGKD